MNKLAISLLLLIGIATVWFYQEMQRTNNHPVVIAFGDSLTEGFGDIHGEGYIDGLEKELNSQEGHQPYRIWNYGIVGQESSGVLKQLNDTRIVSKLGEAEHFIVFIGTNDLLHNNGGDFAPLNEKKIKEGKDQYVENLKKILSILQNENIQAKIAVLGLYNPYPDDKEIEKEIDKWNHTTQQLIKNNERITYVPTNDLFKNKYKSKYFSDSLHLNEKGYKIISRRIMERYDFGV
ncbi:DUF459 domain-containing protein [Peribacillus saganii]|nr:GDSL-type esterase/lipase family protein [Peribacillus saganii]